MVTTTSFARSHGLVKIVKLDVTEFDLSAANQTAQTRVLIELGSNFVVDRVHAITTGAVTSSATLDNLNVIMGVSGDTNAYLETVDLKGTGASVSGKPATTVNVNVSQSDAQVLVTYTPVGTGGDWDTLTATGVVHEYRIEYHDTRGSTS